MNEETTTRPFGETEEKHKTALTEFEAALAMIPDEMKPEFVEAKNVCPELVEKEANRMAFLRREDFNAWAAALRFVMYWKKRKEVFGERAFRPMTLCPEGVFEQTEIDLFATGYVALLPPDLEGSSVVFFDLSRRSQEAVPPLESRIRHVFYLCQQLVSDNPVDQNEGLVCIFRMNDQELISPETVWKEPLDVIHKALPVRVKKLYFVPRSDGGDALTSLMANFSRDLEKASFGDVAPLAVFGDSQNSLSSKLESFGFSLEALPPTVGGKWSYDSFSEWLVNKGLDNGGKPSASASVSKKAGIGRSGDLRSMKSLVEINYPGASQQASSSRRAPRNMFEPHTSATSSARHELLSEALERIPQN